MSQRHSALSPPPSPSFTGEAHIACRLAHPTSKNRHFSPSCLRDHPYVSPAFPLLLGQKRMFFLSARRVSGICSISSD
eukprot:6172666-Pleurochrysis_carterae.AAC.2